MSNTTPLKIPVESENMVELEQRTENLKSQISSVAKDLNNGASSLSSTSSLSLAKIEATLESLYGNERSPAFVSLAFRIVTKRSEAEAQSSSTVYPCIADLKRSAEELLSEISNHKKEYHAAKECVAEYTLFAMEELLKGAIQI